MSDKVVFGYWGIRGAGQVSRLLLAYTGAVWEDVKYIDQEQWFGKDKKQLGLEFPNLPYLIEGDFKISESKAVDLYIISRSDKKDLLGKTVKDQTIVLELLGVAGDIKENLGKLFWDKQWEAKLPAALEKITPKFEQFQKFYQGKDFSLGYLTLADFQLAEFSHYVQKISPETYAKYSFLGRVRQAFEGLPEIKKYYEQESAVKGPFIPPNMAVLGF